MRNGPGRRGTLSGGHAVAPVHHHGRNHLVGHPKPDLTETQLSRCPTASPYGVNTWMITLALRGSQKRVLRSAAKTRVVVPGAPRAQPPVSPGARPVRRRPHLPCAGSSALSLIPTPGTISGRAGPCPVPGWDGRRAATGERDRRPRLRRRSGIPCRAGPVRLRSAPLWGAGPGGGPDARSRRSLCARGSPGSCPLEPGPPIY